LRQKRLKFQSHNGAIAACQTSHTFKLFLEFQSHNGAIAAFLQLSERANLPRFQSHNGAIAACRIFADFDGNFSFNPTMVRLLLAL